IFAQISDENVHLVRTLLEEVFGAKNFCALIPFAKTGGQSSKLLPSVCDYLVWFARNGENVKYRHIYAEKELGEAGASKYELILLPDGSSRRLTEDELNRVKPLPKGGRPYRLDTIKSQGFRTGTTVPYVFKGQEFHPGQDSHWKCTPEGLVRL